MMYVVAAQLATPQRTERRIAEWLNDHFSRWAEPVPQTWIVEGSLAAEQILTGLDGLLEEDDRLVVVKSATEAIWRGLSPDNAEWMASSFPGSLTERIPDPAEGTRS
jgi:hypothetical protein